MAHSLVGLSDSKFDFELVKKEIDHDFFDNPTTSISETKASNLLIKEISPESGENLPAHKDTHNTNLGPCQYLPKNEQSRENCNVTSVLDPQNSSKKLSPAPSSLVFSQDVNSSNEETPVNCPLNTFSTGISQHQNIFCTGELLECLPNTEFCPSTFTEFRDNDTQPGSFTYHSLMSQCASSKGRSNFMQHRLFDLSDSSSEDLDSESECSEIAALDTDDEEFVNMLEKYYESIDLGESDYSDITEVSPLSSLTASPLPQFNGVRANEESREFEEAAENQQVQTTQPMTRNPKFQRRCPLEAKPLPPLIIHTMEEVTAPTAEEPNTPLAVAINPLDAVAMNRIKSSSSLLMTVDQIEKKDQERIVSNSSDPLKQPSEELLSSGSEKNRQSRSFTPSSRMSSGVLSSSTSSQEWSSGTSSKKQVKNYTFTADQMRRIDRENSILLRKILDTSKTHGHGHGNHHWLHVKGTIHHHRPSHHHSLKSSSAILRQRQQKRIDHENSILVRRLKSVKPSKEIIDAGFRPNGDNLQFNI